MPTIVSRIDRRVPAARIAANDDPYSTTRASSRFHQTRCGMWCTSGCAPVAIDVRQTGVSEGNVVTERRYRPASARSASVGAERSSTACSNIEGVSPSMTIRIAARLLRKRAEAGVLLAGPSAGAHRKRGNRGRYEEADERDQRQAEHDDRAPDHHHRHTAARPAAPECAGGEGARAEPAERAADGARDPE